MQHNSNTHNQIKPFTILRLPNSILMRFILLILMFAMLLCMLIGNFQILTVAGLLLIIVLWTSNRFDAQEQQLQVLEQRMQLLEQQLVSQANTPLKNDPLVHSIILPETRLDIEQSNINPQFDLPDPFTENVEGIAQPIQPTFNPNQKDIITPIEQPHLKDTDDYGVMTSLWRASIAWFKGGNSIVRIAVVILLIGVILLLRFASEYWQMTLAAKMLGIATVGSAITALGYYLRHKRFDYAISLQGLGLGVLFLVLFTSYHLNALGSVMVAYMLLIALLALTLWLALKQNALILAFIALGCGFIAPFLLNTGNNDIPALMAYLFVLNAALAVIALFKPWRILNSVALLLTFGIGGLSIWQYATPDQHLMVAVGIWAIFALYLFMSIRYSQHIAPIHQHLKNIPVVDSTLIFATPFMAFSLYAGLVDSEGDQLSIASAILSAVYFAVGYFLHKKFNQLSILSQCFYGLGFVFFALILPFAFNAYWSSVGWAIHGIAMLYLGWRYQLKGAKYFAAVLLMISGIASVIAGFVDAQSLLFASSVLMVVYALAYYLFRAPTVEEKSQTEQNWDHLLSNVFLVFSFTALPYVYDEGLNRLEIYHQNLSLGFLLWFILLSALWWWRDKVWSAHWRKVSYVVLFATALWTLLYQTLWEDQLDLMHQVFAVKIEFLLIALVWCALFASCYQWMYRAIQQVPTIASKILTAFALLFLGLIGTLWATESSIYYLSALLPVVLLISTLMIQPFKSWQNLWIGNFVVICIALIWLTWVCIEAVGDWSLPYILMFNPLDIVSITAFALLTYAIKPYLLSTERTVQLISAATLLVVGLLLVSSILLRMLHHYMGLPYWSMLAWQSSTVQMGLTILWSVLALVLTLLASRKAWRYIWMLGIAVLAVVIAKLIFLDLSQSHTITRIISFIGSGVMMLVIGYFAPLPPKAPESRVDIEKTEA